MMNRPIKNFNRTLEYTDVLTSELTDGQCKKMQEQCVEMWKKPESARCSLTIGYFVARLSDHLFKYPEHVILELVPPALHTDPQLYEKLRLKTALWSYQQTGAQLGKEVQDLVPKLKTPCTIGGLSTEFVNGCLIFIVLYVKQPYSLA